MDQPVAPQDGQQQRQGIPWMKIIGQVVVMQLIFRFFSPKRPAAIEPTTGHQMPPFKNAFVPNEEFDLFVHISPNETANIVDLLADSIDGAQEIWRVPDEKYMYQRWRKDLMINATFTPHIELFERMISEEPALVYLHANAVPVASFLERDQRIIDPEAVRYIPYGANSLISIMPPFTQKELHSLFDQSSDVEEQVKEGEMPHWKAHMDIRMVYDTAAHPVHTLMSPPLSKHMKRAAREGIYLPIIRADDTWLLERDYIRLNGTLKDQPLPLSLSWNIQSHWWFIMSAQMSEVWEPSAKTNNPLMVLQQRTRRETFMMKRILLDTNPYFLAFSVAFMLLHSLFSMLAFKNEIQFWKSTDSMEGLSAGSVVVNLAFEVIVGLYLFDSEDTSWLILMEIMLGIAISSWKVTRALNVGLTSTFPFISFGSRKNYAESKTKEYDQTAIKYMSILMFPLFIGQTVYSLKYEKHKGWYSYIISTLAGGVYTFGFVLMTPQLYINYRLKSVDHLPWRALVYRSLNTFVDDIAAFVIDMPWLHRLSCFRDDVIFVLYIYQRWIYKVDHRRQTWKTGEALPEVEVDTAAIMGPPNSDSLNSSGDVCEGKPDEGEKEEDGKKEEGGKEKQKVRRR